MNGSARPLITVAAALLVAVCVSLVMHPGSLRHLLFHTGLYAAKSDVETIQRTVKLFNTNFASFFNTGGDLSGLNDFPAGNLVKRRVFQDINSLKESNTLLVYDRDATKVDKIMFLAADRAVAETSETWFLVLQDAATRRRLSPAKADKIKVRYLLKLTPRRWEVEEYQVFGAGDDISRHPVKEF